VPDWWWEKLRRKGKWRSDWLGLHRELLRKLEARRRQLTQHSIVTVRASPSGGTGSSGPEGTQAECERPQESGSAPKMLHGMGGGRGRPWAVWDAPPRSAPAHARMAGVRDGKGGSGSCQCAGNGESACSSRFRFWGGSESSRRVLRLSLLEEKVGSAIVAIEGCARMLRGLTSAVEVVGKRNDVTEGRLAAVEEGLNTFSQFQVETTKQLNTAVEQINSNAEQQLQLNEKQSQLNACLQTTTEHVGVCLRGAATQGNALCEVHRRATDAISGVSGTVRAIASVVAELVSADGAGLLGASSNGGVRLLRSLPGDDGVSQDDPDDAFSDADLSSLDGC
jgi:hypothetical protein